MNYLQKVFRGLFLSVLIALISPAVMAIGLLNFTVDETRMYRITYEDLVNEGFDLEGLKRYRFAITTVDPDTGEQTQVQLRTKRQTNGSLFDFGPGSYIEFYAEYTPNLYSDSATYTLHYDKKLRSLVKSLPNSGQYNPNATFGSEYLHTSLIEQNGGYDMLSPSMTDPYHYGYVAGQGFTQGPDYSFDLENVASADASIEVELFGISDVSEAIDHSVSINVNSIEAGSSDFSGSSIETIQLPQAGNSVSVQEGQNTLRVDLTGDLSVPFDVVALNKFKVKYQRQSEVTGDYLHGELPSGHFEAEGFTSQFINVYYKMNDGSLAYIYKGKVKKDEPNPDSWRVRFNAGQAGEYFVVGENGYKKPGVDRIYDDADISNGDAEYLIITSSEFVGPDLDTFVALRSAKYSVKVVDVQQIYGQFGIHQPTAKSIKDYVKFAVSNLGTKYVLIIGGDTYDYNDVEGTGVVSHVPTNYVKTPSGNLPINHAPSDAAYGDLDDDGIPEIPVGRFPLRVASELANVVNKVSLYESRQGYQGKVMVVADKYDDGSLLDFKADALSTIEQMPLVWKNSITDQFKAFPDDDGDAAARAKLLAAINAGVEVTTYVGHSSQQQWSANPVIFKANDVANLSNVNLPTLVTQWGCWNTYFVRPTSNSMAEVLMLAEDKGAVAVLGASTLTSSTDEAKLGRELSSRMYNPGVAIGDAVIASKQAMAATSPNAADIFLGWNLIGDPALVIQPL